MMTEETVPVLVDWLTVDASSIRRRGRPECGRIPFLTIEIAAARLSAPQVTYMKKGSLMFSAPLKTTRGGLVPLEMPRVIMMKSRTIFRLVVAVQQRFWISVRVAVGLRSLVIFAPAYPIMHI